MQKSSSKSSLFLIELILSILFFAIAAAVCARAFVRSHNMSSEAGTLGMAQIVLEDAQHQISAGIEPDEIALFYDGDWNACKEEDAEYYLVIEETDREQDSAGALVTYRLSACDAGNRQILTLSFSEYDPWKLGDTADSSEKEGAYE